MSAINIQNYKWPTILYRGSGHLYHVHCYIHKMRLPLARYLSDINSQYHSIKETAPDDNFKEWKKQIQYAISKYTILMPNEFSPLNPWTCHVVFLFTMNAMYELKIPILRISEFLAELLPEYKISNPIYQKSYDELLSWSSNMDECKDLRDVDYKGLLKLDFFNVMRQPIQFFGSETIANIYAKNGTHEIYTYELSAEIRVVNISDPSTIQNLMTVGMPYYSTKSYPIEVTKYFECNVGSMRVETIGDILEVYYDPIEKSMEDYEVETQRLDETWKQLKWYLARELSIGYYDEGSVQKLLRGYESWSDFLTFIVPELYKKQRDLWLDLVKKYDISTGGDPRNQANVNAEIIQWIMSEYPEINDDNIDPFLELMDSLYFNNVRQRREDRRFILMQQMAPFFEHLGSTFQINVGAESNLQTFLEKIGDRPNHHQWVSIVHDIVDIWSSLFQIEIVSPRGLWLIAHWKTLNPGFRNPIRFSRYNVDCLLVYSLTTSSWFQENHINGWVCHNPYEVMVCRPELYGQIRRVQDTYNEECDYEYAED